MRKCRFKGKFFYCNLVGCHRFCKKNCYYKLKYDSWSEETKLSVEPLIQYLWKY